MIKNKFIKIKPHINVGTIGHIDHGKTTLTSAITKVLSLKGLSKVKSYSEIDSAPEEKLRGITINTSHIEYESESKHYAHIDCPGHSDYIKNMIVGVTQMDCAILVISLLDGPMPQTIEHLLLISQIGIKTLIVFLNKEDKVDDKEIVDFVEEEVISLANKYGYTKSNTYVLKGSALKALECANSKEDLNNIWVKKILDLIEVMDKNVQVLSTNIDEPFLMPIEDSFLITGRGTVVTGKIERGSVKPGDKVELIGNDNSILTTAIDIEMFNKMLDIGEVGDNIGILLRNIKKNNVKRGYILAKPNTVKSFKLFESSVYILSKTEGGRHKPFFTGYKPQFFIRTSDITGEVKNIFCITNEVTNELKMAMPGDSINITIELQKKTVLHVGLRFAIREGGKTIGAGIITKIID